MKTGISIKTKGNGKVAQVLRGASIFLAVVSFTTTMEGLMEYSFESYVLASFASLGAQGVLLSMAFFWPILIEKVQYKKTTNTSRLGKLGLGKLDVVKFVFAAFTIISAIGFGKLLCDVSVIFPITSGLIILITLCLLPFRVRITHLAFAAIINVIALLLSSVFSFVFITNFAYDKSKYVASHDKAREVAQHEILTARMQIQSSFNEVSRALENTFVALDINRSVPGFAALFSGHQTADQYVSKNIPNLNGYLYTTDGKPTSLNSEINSEWQKYVDCYDEANKIILQLNDPSIEGKKYEKMRTLQIWKGAIEALVNDIDAKIENFDNLYDAMETKRNNEIAQNRADYLLNPQHYDGMGDNRPFGSTGESWETTAKRYRLDVYRNAKIELIRLRVLVSEWKGTIENFEKSPMSYFVIFQKAYENSDDTIIKLLNEMESNSTPTPSATPTPTPSLSSDSTTTPKVSSLADARENLINFLDGIYAQKSNDDENQLTYSQVLSLIANFNELYDISTKLTQIESEIMGMPQPPTGGDELTNTLEASTGTGDSTGKPDGVLSIDAWEEAWRNQLYSLSQAIGRISPIVSNNIASTSVADKTLATTITPSPAPTTGTLQIPSVTSSPLITSADMDGSSNTRNTLQQSQDNLTELIKYRFTKLSGLEMALYHLSGRSGNPEMARFSIMLAFAFDIISFGIGLISSWKYKKDDDNTNAPPSVTSPTPTPMP